MSSLDQTDKKINAPIQWNASESGDGCANQGGEKNIPLISVVVPVFNEEECLPELIRRFCILRTKMQGDAKFEFVFVNDGSSDASLRIIIDAAAESTEIKGISLSRNFGHQIAVSAGVDAASGDYIVIIDADLQDPPELIQDMFNLARRGGDVVYAQRRERTGESWFKRTSAKAFYRVIASMSDTPIPLDTGDFRLITRRVADILKSMPEKNRFLRGMVPWIGFRSAPLLYDRDIRYAGVTKYPLQKMIKLAINAITSFSAKPLMMVVQLGIAMLGLGVIAACVLLYLKIFTEIVVPGITSILIAIVIFNGVQILLVGVVGTYVARIFDEIKSRPLYVTEQTINL